VAGEGELVLEGEVPEQMVFGANYLLRTRLTLRKASARVEIEDTLANLGAAAGEYEMLYHTNFGPPFLEGGGRYLGSFAAVVPRDEAAAAGLASLRSFPAPAADFVEQVFLFRAHPDARGFAHQLMINAAGSLAAKVSFRADTLPYTILWKRCAALADGYVAGMNPCSDLPNPRRQERQEGRVGRVAAGTEVRFSHRIELFEGSEAVRRVEREVQDCAGQQSVGAAGDFAFLMA
jgi:hypothetical protein